MERSFHMLLFRAFHARRSYLGPSLKELGFGSGQPKLVDYLDRRGPCRQRELSDYFEVDPAAVSRMLSSLEKRGYVVRRVDGARRRRDLVEVTALLPLAPAQPGGGGRDASGLHGGGAGALCPVPGPGL